MCLWPNSLNTPTNTPRRTRKSSARLDFNIDTHTVNDMKTRNQISIDHKIPLPTVIDRIAKRRIKGKIVKSVLHYTPEQVEKIVKSGTSGRPKSKGAVR